MSSHLGDTEQRIYAWRKGVSATRLQDVAETLGAAVFDFQNENNRSPATGIARYARCLLSPAIHQELPDDIEFRRFQPGQFSVGLRFALIRTWNETVKRTGRRDLSVVVAARSRTMVRLISDALAQRLTVNGKEHRPMSHDVMFDQTQDHPCRKGHRIYFGVTSGCTEWEACRCLGKDRCSISVFRNEVWDQDIGPIVGLGRKVPQRKSSKD